MAVWQQSSALSNELKLALKHQYSEIFQLEIRHYLAHWLEEQLL